MQTRIRARRGAPRPSLSAWRGDPDSEPCRGPPRSSCSVASSTRSARASSSRSSGSTSGRAPVCRSPGQGWCWRPSDSPALRRRRSLASSATASDRRPCACCCSPLRRADSGAFVAVHDFPTAIAAAVLAGIGNGAFWPAQSTLLSALTGADERTVVFAANRAAMNMGIGLGGVVGGFIAVNGRPSTYDRLFVIDVVTFVLFAAVVATINVPPAPAAPAHEPSRRSAPCSPSRSFGGCLRWIWPRWSPSASRSSCSPSTRPAASASRTTSSAASFW